MNPDRMVIKEAQRTFTYLNLYGYLTDAVIVNRVFPDELAGGYFGEWRERQREQLEEVRSGFAPVPVLTARYFDEEVIGTADARPPRRRAVRRRLDPAESIMHTELAHEIDVATTGPRPCGSGCRSASAARSALKKVGPELIVSVGPRKRTIILPAALARRSPTGGEARRRARWR